MKIWHVTFTSHGFELDAVVVEATYGLAVALLKLNPDERLKDCLAIGVASGDLKPRVVTQDRFVEDAR